MASFSDATGKKEGKKILICGAGSIGIFLGAKLLFNGHEVHLFGRRKLKKAGDEIFIDGKKFNIPSRLFSAPKNSRYHSIFITSKLYDLDKMVNIIKTRKIRGKIISCIQNGIIDNSKYSKTLGKKILPICVYGGFRIEKNRLMSAPTKIGWITENSNDGREISRIISQSGINCRADKNFESFRVEKFITNSCLNALSAIEKKPFNVLFSEKKTGKRILKLFDECYNVLKEKYSLDKKENIKRRMINNWKNVRHYSSTYQDLISGRKTEINFFNGYIVKLAKELGISADENKKILEDFKAA